MMFIFMGTYNSGSGGDSNEEYDSQDESPSEDTSQPNIEDYTGENGDDEAREEFGSGGGCCGSVGGGGGEGAVGVSS